MCFVGLIRTKEHELSGTILLESEEDVELRWRRDEKKHKA